MDRQGFAAVLRFLRQRWLFSLLVTASLAFLVWRWADIHYGRSDCPRGVARHAPHPVTRETCPTLGQMNGIKLAIPGYYLLGPIGFKGIDIWNAESWKNRPKTNSFDNEFDNFAIRIRLTNFRPIESVEDKRDYEKLGSIIGPPPAENRWIHVGIQVWQHELNFRTAVAGWLKDQANRGPYEALPQVWQLNHYSASVKPSVDDTTWAQTTQWEFFYDPVAWRTFIYCRNVVTPTTHIALKQCTHKFFMDELRASVEIDTLYNETELASWAAREREVSKIIRNFVVK